MCTGCKAISIDDDGPCPCSLSPPTKISIIPSRILSDEEADGRRLGWSEEREAIVTWLRLQISGLVGTGRAAEINTLTLVTDVIEKGVPR